MSAHLPSELERFSSRSLRAHALGFLGANLAIGALVLWFLPLLFALWDGLAASWSLRRMLAPWSDAPEVTGLALIGDALVVVLVGLGALLMCRAARMLQAERS